MYADRHDSRHPLKPASLAISIAANAGLIAMVALAAPVFVRPPPKPPITLIDIAAPPIPDPLPPPDRPDPRTDQPERLAPRPDQPGPIVDRPDSTLGPVFVDPGPAGGDIGIVDGIGAGTGAILEPPPPPAIVEPVLDDRFSNSFQPQYPPDERRGEREGRVVLRVLVGIDGRVRQVERVSATSDSFYTAAARQALAKWRFRPGTRGGLPVERWTRIGVSFRLDDGR